MDNLWIAALDPADRRRLEPHLNERPFAQGQMLYDAGGVTQRDLDLARFIDETAAAMGAKE